MYINLLIHAAKILQKIDLAKQKRKIFFYERKIFI